jgi:putative lipoic acid-binding regulatory protein
MVMEYYRMKESNKGQFASVRMNYHVWRRRFIATVHSLRRLISDKAKKSLVYCH